MTKYETEADLDYIQDGDVAVLGGPVPVRGCAYHHVLWLQQTTHHVQDSRLTNIHVVLLRQ